MKRLVIGLAAVFALVLLSGCVGLDFSPDGKSIAVLTSRGIAILPVDGGESRLLPESKGALMPVWSPDSTRILFTREMGQKSELFIYDSASNRSRQIGSGLGWPYAWREDSKRVAAAQRISGDAVEMVWYDLAEGGIAQSVEVPEPQIVVWLPETDNIALLASSHNKKNVHTVENAEVKQITRTGDIVGFGLSPDKKALLWARKGANLKYQLLSIYRYDLKTRSAARIEFPMRVPMVNPDSARAPRDLHYVTFSPTGGRLALVVERAGKGGAAVQACYVTRLDGSDARLVRQTPGRSVGEFLFPVWSRDGSKLGVYDVQGKQLVTAVFDAGGRNGKRLLTETTP